MDKGLQDWLEHGLALAGLLISLWKINKNNQEASQKRHEDNIVRLTAIETTLNPITRWFNRHVIEGSSGD